MILVCRDGVIRSATCGTRLAIARASAARKSSASSSGAATGAHSPPRAVLISLSSSSRYPSPTPRQSQAKCPAQAASVAASVSLPPVHFPSVNRTACRISAGQPVSSVSASASQALMLVVTPSAVTFAIALRASSRLRSSACAMAGPAG